MFRVARFFAPAISAGREARKGNRDAHPLCEVFLPFKRSFHIVLHGRSCREAVFSAAELEADFVSDDRAGKHIPCLYAAFRERIEILRGQVERSAATERNRQIYREPAVAVCPVAPDFAVHALMRCGGAFHAAVHCGAEYRMAEAGVVFIG